MKHIILIWAVLLAPLGGWAQTLILTNGVQTYATLTNTTVMMSNRCELRVTAIANPIPGCTINLTSSNAWFFLPGIKPSVVVSTYLGQVFVNGAAAIADSNVRVVQYAAGTVVIPHPPSFQPLQVFSGPHFTGASTNFSQYIYYIGTGLGGMDQTISSFKLKRGYQAVVAQNTSGSGISKCYVAQDGDLEVSLLPSSLDNKIRFIYVTPWRWTGKKGIAGDPGLGLLNVNSWYNWSINQSSSRDLEYVAIRHIRWDPSLSQNWQALGVNTVLGYNEPDQANQANMLVGDAIYSWPDLLGTGLRVGSPAPSDGGRSSWLYPFITQADAAGLRVDFCAVHYYQSHNPADAAGCASQMYNFLLDVWNNTHRPIWVTEWNNGANWTDGQWPVPTYAQQQACVSAMINMLETTPFVERYNLYNWVENGRAVTTNGVLTAAGVTYRDKVSALSYVQTLPDNGSRSLSQFLFETNALDTSGYGNNALAVGAPAYTTGHSGQALGLDGTNNFVLLPPNIASSNSFTFAAWVYWNGGSAPWQRIFDFGNDTTHYLFLTPNANGTTLRFAINNGSGEQLIETSILPVGQWRHVAVTLSGSTAKLYVNGALATSSSAFTISPASFIPKLNYLGKSQFPNDPLFRGQLDDVLITDYALTAAQIAALQTNLPPQFTNSLIALNDAAPSQPYNATLANAATDPNPGDLLSYGKASGPAWLAVAANGTLSGAPGASDFGTNNFIVRVTDAAGASAFAILVIKVSGLANGGFEAPTTSTFVYTPTGGSWTFSTQFAANGSGLSANNSAFNTGNTNAPEGVQCAFVQGTGNFFQALGIFVPGAKYSVTFAAAQRAYSIANGGQTWQVKIDNTVIGAFSPAANATNYVDYTATNFTATAVTHTLRFVGTDSRGGDNTVLLDNVRLALISPPAPPPAPANFQATASDSQVVLTWNAATFATGYNVKRSVTSATNYVTIASQTTTTYADTNAANGTTYYYELSAVNSGGEGTNTVEISAHPVSTAILPLGFAPVNNGLQFDWPADHTGWRLMMNTNDLSDPNAWTGVPNSAATNQLWVPFDAGAGSVFFRLVYP